MFDRFVAGQLAATRELAYFFAPNVNSYKRYAWGSFAPTTLVWGVDNRTCGFRVVGHGQGLRLESSLFGILAASEDMHEGLQAFLEKRPAQFQRK